MNFASFLLIPPEVLCKINFAYFTGKHLCWSLFLKKLQSLTWNFTRKETLAQVFSCDFFEILKRTFFYKTPLSDCFCYSVVFSTFRVSQLTYNRSNHQIMFRRMRVSKKYKNEVEQHFTINKQETRRVITIAFFCSSLASLSKFNIFGGLYMTESNIYDGAFIAKVVSQSTLTRTFHCRCSLGF